MAHLLLIEPNTLLAQTYTKALEHDGHRVTHVTNAQAAIDAADAATPELVLLELQLTLHNGIEFLHEFRSYPEWRRVPVVVNTMLPPSQLAAAQASLQRDLGVCQLLYKPRATLQQIVRAVREQLAAV